MSRLCPDDRSPLIPQALHGLTLDVCPQCAGIYFDEGEITALHDGGPSAFEAVEQATEPGGLVVVDCEAPKRCPGCGGVMCAYRYRYSSDIGLDGCEKCGGVWVQEGELAKIAVHLTAPPKSFGGIPAARRAAESLNAGGQRHESLLQRVAGLMRR